MSTLRASLGTGEATFRHAHGGGVDVSLRNVCVAGLTDGLHGFHVHERGDAVCERMGGHYDPHGSGRHGGPRDAHRRHAGDLGNVRSQGECVEDVTVHAPDLTLGALRGRGVVLHAREDDLGLAGTRESRTTGSAGARVACGTIR